MQSLRRLNRGETDERGLRKLRVVESNVTQNTPKLSKLGPVAHARYFAFRKAEVAVSKILFADVLQMIEELRPSPVSSTA